ncbi:universal stress protein [Microvirga guangxiensis]|uniref:Universal stress protein family protein n=1 Tax=Microvirga guangxiensis TaxID=549386 RepID=A0A1G5KB80_9HYPH|nr:universal stress protein [Microvirga guangxiensis]SCY97229.1 Universal stress protein family protein [Microvirga guangxiensis]
MIRDVMVHLDGSPEDEIRLEYGQTLASGEGAHLIGIFTNLLPDLSTAMPFDGGAAAVVQIVTELEQQARKDGDATAGRLADRITRLPVPTELRRFDETFGTMSIRVAEQARYADLFVATRPYGAGDTPVWLDLVEAVLFGSGRGLLVVPPGHRQSGPVRTVLVAWNGSREAARALGEGLGFIQDAARTVVLMIDPKGNALMGQDIERHLARHGVTAEIVAVESRGRRVADVVLDEARRVSADLVVMGGYGHTRLREQVFGGATLDMLTISDRPVLLAH